MLQNILNKLDLASAVHVASQPNDLVPPRSDDKVGGELADRFIEHLTKRIKEGKYSPDPCAFVSVPKPGFTSRPAAILTLVDRVVYEALVAPLRPGLGKYMLDSEIVLWPRENYVSKRWQEFEKLPLSQNNEYIVQADISGFYDSIDHEILEDDIVNATGKVDIAHALIAFLSRIMNAKRGLPQGLMPSDTLATTFLQPFDATLVRAGLSYWRHGDDMRIGVEDISRAREAIAISETALRSRGLLINASKCAILTRSNYESDLASGDAANEAVRKTLYESKLNKVKSSTKSLTEVMKEAKLDEQIGWDLFYHGSITIDDVIPQLEKHLQPEDIKVAEQLFLTTVELAPGNPNSISKELFHQQLVRSLVRLTAARSTIALPFAPSILTRFPDKTEYICKYLIALMKVAPKEVVDAVQNVLLSTTFTTPWQQAWLYRTLSVQPSHIPEDIINHLKAVASSEQSHWIARTEAAKVLGQAQKLEKDIAIRLWSLSPEVYRNEIIAAVALASETNEWAKRFLGTSRLDPVQQVVARHLQHKK